MRLAYPFKSKTKQDKISKDYPNVHVPILDTIPDKKIKPFKKYMRPNFAPEPYSWEMDFVLGPGRNNKTYLILVNINTRFVYALCTHSILSRERDLNIEFMLDYFISCEQQDGLKHPVNNIKADKDVEFQPLRRMRKYKDINFYLQDSEFTNHNKHVDAVIRTLRNALGPNTNHLWDGRHNDIIQQLVQYYNLTHHNAINMSPFEMHKDVDKEWEYIRKMTEIVNDIKVLQRDDGLSRYTPGTVLMVHLDLGKTNAKFGKQRRVFNYSAIFREYRNGNAVVELLEPINVEGKSYTVVEVPLYHCVKIDKYTLKQRDATFKLFKT